MANGRYRVLVLGGYGAFGSRICAALARDPRIAVLVAGRSLGRAEALAAALRARDPATAVATVACDARSTRLAGALRDLAVDAVIHAAGPFQGQDYAVATACIEAGTHYVDLADARDFVVGIDALDEAARARGVLVVSGASTVPGLSAAVVDRHADDFARLLAIDCGISPGNRTPRGPAIVAAILSSCGRSFTRWDGGRWKEAFGWQGLGLRAYPAPMGRRWLSGCDIPDLALFPIRYPGVERVVFRAGLELSVLHLGLWCLSWLARWGLVADWSRYASQLGRIGGSLAGFGSDVGGMHVALRGELPDGSPATVVWQLVGERGDGPQVPCTPAVLLAKKLARGALAVRGARPCLDLFTLDEFLAELAPFAIRTSVERDPAQPRKRSANSGAGAVHAERLPNQR